MNIDELNINSEAEEIVEVGNFKFKCLTYIPADKYGDILVDAVAPLFYREHLGNTVLVDILESPKSGERYLLAHKDVYLCVALAKHLTDIEINEEDDYKAVYDKLVSNGIDKAIRNTIGVHYDKVRWIIDQTITARIKQICNLKK